MKFVRTKLSGGRSVLVGLIIGAVSGVLQFWMLTKFTQAVTGGGLSGKTAMLGISQFFLPLVVLLGCAFLLNNALLWAALGMIITLVISAFAKFALNKR